MKAKLTHDFSVAPEGHTVHHLKAGEEVSGRIAEVALASGVAIEISDSPVVETKVVAPSETKAKKPRKRRLFSK